MFSKLLNDFKSKEIQIQLIQSANILIHNLSIPENKSNTKIGFLLASQFFKLLVTIKFNFLDDEIVEIYMSFLKGMAANLPSDLLLSFVVHYKFAFFSRSLMFFYHSDSMFKNAARTGILRMVKCNFHSVNDPRIFQHLIRTNFIPEILKNVQSSWDKFNFLINRQEKFKRDYYITSISDDLCYLNDLMCISEDLQIMICRSFFSICFSWVLERISEISKNNSNFNGIGFIVYSILQYIQSKLVLDIVISSLFSAEISEKIQALAKGKGNYQEELLVEEVKIRNEVKIQVQNIMKNGLNTAVVLILVNCVAGNKSVSKSVLFESCLLGKEDIKSQLLLRKILQDNKVYSSDKFLVQLLIKIICSQQTVFNVFLACKLINICKLYPEEVKFRLLREKLASRVLELVKALIKQIQNEKNSIIVLEAFEDGFKFVSELNFSQKIKFPNELLFPIEATTASKFRIPIGQKESYLWYFNILFIIGSLNSELFCERKFGYFDQIIITRKIGPPVQVFECRNQEKIEIYEFFLSVYQDNQEKIINLSRSKIETDPKDNKIIHIVCNEVKNCFNLRLEFDENDKCKKFKNLIDDLIKESKLHELRVLTDYLESFIQIKFN